MKRNTRTALGLCFILAAAAVWALGPTRAQEKAAPGGGTPAMQCPMMAGLHGLELYADGPAVLLARADELGLTALQKKQLEEIRESARKQAREVLTEEQRGRLKGEPEGPLSPMALSRARMAKMKDKEDMMCPMCMKMMQMMKEKMRQKEAGKLKPEPD